MMKYQPSFDVQSRPNVESALGPRAQVSLSVSGYTQAMTQEANMKRSLTRTGRKHGTKARADQPRDSTTGRLKTRLTFETSNQAYLWVTDRGRSRLLKH